MGRYRISENHILYPRILVCLGAVPPTNEDFFVIGGDKMGESRIKDENYYQIQGWMINRLGLKGVPLNVYAIIYGFSQDGETEYTGSLQYLCDFCGGVSKPTIIKALSELVEAKYIFKREEFINGVKFNRYKVNLPLLKIFKWGGKETLMGVVKDFNGGSKETLPNNKRDNKGIDNKRDNKDIIDENFENLWKMLKSTPYDRKSKVSKKRKKELFDMGIERTTKAIDVYLQTQNPNYYHKRDNFLNEIIENYLDKDVSDISAERGASNERVENNGDSNGVQYGRTI